jgi:hypothetical protein
VTAATALNVLCASISTPTATVEVSVDQRVITIAPAAGKVAPPGQL